MPTRTPRDICFDEQVAERTDPAWADLRPQAELEARRRRWAEEFDRLARTPLKAPRAA